MSRRDFASWADPTVTRPTRTSRVPNPFAGLLGDLAQVARGWRWGRARQVPRGVGGAAGEVARAQPAPRRPFTDVVGRLRVTGLEAGGPTSRVVLAHVESPADLDVLLATLPRRWRVVTTRVPRALARGRSVLLVTDFAAPGSAEVAAEAATLAARNHRELVPVVVRRLRPAPADERPGLPARGPRPRLDDEVRVRFADPVTEAHPVAAARAAKTAVAALLAEDDATWWAVLRGEAASPLAEPMAPWRRTWTRTAPSATGVAGRRRKPIWG